MEPIDSTFSLENPRRWGLTGSSFSFPMPILSKVERMSSIQTKKSLNDDEGIPRYSDLLNVNPPLITSYTHESNKMSIITS